VFTPDTSPIPAIPVRSFCIVSSGAKQFGVSVLAPDRILRRSRSRKC
jgi:hypothetical protein